MGCYVHDIHLHAEDGPYTQCERLRERIPIEHGQAHLCRRQGPRARYRGTRKNLFDVRRAATVENLDVIDRRMAA